MSTSLINRAVGFSFTMLPSGASACGLRNRTGSACILYLFVRVLFFIVGRGTNKKLRIAIFFVFAPVSRHSMHPFSFFCRTSLALRNTNQFRDRIQFLHFREFCASSLTELQMALCLGQSLLPEAVAA